MSWHESDFDCVESVNAAAYVLGALDESERYSDHLATCATCQAEVAELQLAVDVLRTAVPGAVAPKDIRERVLALVRSDTELLRAAGQQAAEPSNRPSRWRSRRVSLPTAGVAIAASAAVAAAIVLNVDSSASERVTRAQVVASIPGAHASLHQISGRAELVISGMPQPPLGKIYEVWLSRAAGSPQPTDALFGVTSKGSGSVDVPGNLHGVLTVIVTREPLGGSSRPTSTPLIRVNLHA